MVFGSALHVGGSHSYRYSILDGNVGAADGVGFVFDSKICHNNIKRMRSVFLSSSGQVCVQNLEQIPILDECFPKLAIGLTVRFQVNLDHGTLQIEVQDVA